MGSGEQGHPWPLFGTRPPSPNESVSPLAASSILGSYQSRGQGESRFLFVLPEIRLD